MNNLTTRKIVLGLLVTLVLVFSVQGTADAITKFTRGAGDLKLYAPGNDFTISFTVGLHSKTLETAASTSSGKTTPATYFYDDQAISITASGANIRKIGNTEVTPGTFHSMNQMGEGPERLTSSRISVTLRAAAAGLVTITIVDSNVDYPTGDDAPPDVPDLVFTVYIAPEIDTTSELGYVQTAGTDTDQDSSDDTFFDGVAVGRGVIRIDDDFSGVDDVRVTYTVSGSGRVYVETADNKGSESQSLTTSGSAPVYLDMRGSTNTVTVSIVGQRASRDKKSYLSLSTYRTHQTIW